MKQFEDRLGKYIIGSLFGDYTRVEVGTDLLPNTFYADVLLLPDKPLANNIPGAGLLTRLTQDARCLIEPFSGTVKPVRLEGTVTKLRLALQRAYDDHLGVFPPKGVLWIIVPYWPQNAIKQIFVEPGEEIEKGVLKWQCCARETVYIVNTSVISLREETLVFRLLGQKQYRKEALIKIFTEHLEPYVTLLNNFDLRFKKMTQSNHIQNIDPEELKNMIDLRDTRAEVLQEIGKKEGKKEGRKEGRKEGAKKRSKEIAQRMLKTNIPIEQIASLTMLSIEEIEALK